LLIDTSANLTEAEEFQMSISNTEKCVKNIRRKTRRKFSSEEKIGIVLDGLRGEHSIAELCRKERINNNLYYCWGKDFLETGKKRLAGDTVREASTDEVVDLKKKNTDLKKAVTKPATSKLDWGNNEQKSAS
jgi:transposase|tara:strand:- start:854 stop:1249 length:396 start_codon:yes stop_codon:yes gene_type:complete